MILKLRLKYLESREAELQAELDRVINEIKNVKYKLKMKERNKCGESSER